MNGIVNLATTIPSAPGYVGTFDTPGIAVLAAYGVDRDLAFGYTIVLHAALWFPITILGAWFFRREQLAWSDVEETQKFSIHEGTKLFPIDLDHTPGSLPDAQQFCLQDCPSTGNRGPGP